MKRQSVLIIVLVVLAIGAGAWWFATNYQPASKTNISNTIVNANSGLAPLPTSVKYQGQDGRNALELLQADHTVVDVDGFVKAIDGRANTKNFYWFLYVNDKQAEVGAQDVITKSSDQLEWKYEELK